MKHVLFFFIFLTAIVRAQMLSLAYHPNEDGFKTGRSVLHKLHRIYKHQPCKAYTFSQKNTHYAHDSVVGTSVWHESIEFPDKFRIDFGEKTEGNYVIFRNDSSYSYKNFQLRKAVENTNTLLLLLGGMYYRPFNEVIKRLTKEHFDTEKLTMQHWRGEEIYIIGASAGDTISNQIWVSKKVPRIVRIIEKTDEERIMDMTFDAFQKNCGAYTETKVTFKSNGKTEQIEEYYDIKEVAHFPEEVFNPKQ